MSRLKDNVGKTYQYLWDTIKAAPKGKAISVNAHIGKLNDSSQDPEE